MKRLKIIIEIFFALLPLGFFSGCSNTPRNVPFPAEETEFTQPVSKPFKFSEPKKISWIIRDMKNFKPIRETSFDINTLPSHPIDLGGFRAFLKPMAEKKLDWESLPSTTFNIDSLPSKILRFKTSVLGQPKRIKSGLPSIKEEATQNIFIYGYEQGLPGTVVQGLLQDKSGIMWFGTENGICRFDGEYCEIFTIEQGLSHNYIKAFFEDSWGRIWIAASGGGIDLLDLKTATVRHLGMSEGLSNSYTLCFLEDKKGRIWVGTDGGVNIIDEKAGTIKYLGIAAGRVIYNGNNFLEDREGKIWIATNCGVVIIDEKAGILKRISHEHGLGAITCKSLFENRQGKIWIGLSEGGGINVIDPKTGTIQYLNSEQGLDNQEVCSIVEDDFNKIWVGGPNGINVIDEKSGMIKHIGTTDGLSAGFANLLLKDNNGQIWASTFGSGGVDVINESTGIISHLSTLLDLNYAPVSGLLEDSKERIWVGTWGNGADVINPEEGAFKYFGIQTGLVNGAIRCLMEYDPDEIWIGTHGSGIQIIDEKTRKSKLLTMDQGLNDNYITCLLKDNLGQIWIGTINGISVVNKKNATVKHLTTAQGLSNHYVSGLFLDSRGRIWVGTDGGDVNVVDQKTGTIRHLKPSQNTGNSYVGCLLEDSHGKIWIGSAGGGLALVDEKAGTITNFSVMNGLADMAVSSLKERNGKLFVGTKKGLSVIHSTPVTNGKQNWVVKAYATFQGFPHIEFQTVAPIASKKNKFWFANGKGVTVMGEPKEDSLVPLAYITGIDIMNQRQYFVNDKFLQSILHGPGDTIWSTANDTFYVKGKLPPDTGYLQKNNIKWNNLSNTWYLPIGLTLPYHQNHITFYFSGTHLDNRDKTRYRYILEGNDKAWSGITDQAFADYRNLLPGKYTFKVCSRGFNGLWSNPAILSFIINPPWWLTWWAYCLYALLVVSMVYTLYRNRINGLKNRQAAQIKAMVATQEEERKRLSRDLHDDVGTKLSALKLFLSSLKNNAQKKQYQQVDQLASNSEQLINDTIKDVREMLLNLSPGILEEFGYASAIEGLINKINQTNTIHFHLSVFGIKGKLRNEYELALYRITQELINNVLKHSDAKNVSLQMGYRDEKIIIMIEDDGKGFDLNKHKDGYGLKNLEVRTKLLNGNMNIDSQTGKGTSVLIEVPYKFS